MFVLLKHKLNKGTKETNHFSYTAFVWDSFVLILFFLQALFGRSSKSLTCFNQQRHKQFHQLLQCFSFYSFFVFGKAGFIIILFQIFLNKFHWIGLEEKWRQMLEEKNVLSCLTKRITEIFEKKRCQGLGLRFKGHC